MLSIPRLELCAVLLLAQSLRHIHTLLSTISRMYGWTDSLTVLSWLTSKQKYFKIFVTNRVTRIHELVPDCQWFHVLTLNNAADPASRGLLLSSVAESSLH